MIKLSPVQQTSLLVAYWRMLETGRSAMKNAPSLSLIQHELATFLVGRLASKGLVQKFQSSPFLPIGINCLAVRTRVIDDWLLRYSRRGSPPRQVVNLGAGMCTRPYRLDMSESTVVYEVDDPHLLNAKRQVLKEVGHEPRVALVDFAGDVTKMNKLTQSLMEKGFDSSLPTDWVGEGLFAYLEPAYHMPVFQGCKMYSGPGSRFMFTLCDPFCKDYVVNMMGVSMPWASLRPIPDVILEVSDAGWSRDVTILDDEDFMRLFQRTITLPIVLVSAETDGDPIAEKYESSGHE